MKRDAFYETLVHELNFQKKLFKDCTRKQRKVPAGYLYVRESAHNKQYYQITRKKINGVWKTKQRNITDKPAMVKRLAQKAANKKLKKIYAQNIKTMERVLEKYCPLTTEVLPEKCRELLKTENMLPRNYEKAPFDARYHIHGTACGIMVRSKSEALIANALWHYGIPFRYEEKFYHPDGTGVYFYPDFTIYLPDGRKIIWEQLGLLAKPGYCEDTAYKMNAYQQGGYVIGKNLILTQDDMDGGCDSAFVYHIIEEYILPYFV